MSLNQGMVDFGKATGFQIIRKQKKKQKKQNEKVFPLMAFKAQLKRNVRSGVFLDIPIDWTHLRGGFGTASARLWRGCSRFQEASAGLLQGFRKASAKHFSSHLSSVEFEVICSAFMVHRVPRQVSERKFADGKFLKLQK